MRGRNAEIEDHMPVWLRPGFCEAEYRCSECPHAVVQTRGTRILLTSVRTRDWCVCETQRQRVVARYASGMHKSMTL